ncbi:acylphosphatase [Chloroflexota bacterium]
MNNSDLASLHAIVRGRVQGVFFRAYVRNHADVLRLTGYVRNLTDSRAVEVKVEGERDKLEKLLQNLHQGPPEAGVEKVETSWGDYSGEFSIFSVKY